MSFYGEEEISALGIRFSLVITNPILKTCGESEQLGTNTLQLYTVPLKSLEGIVRMT